jgi:hypothetical protein
MEQFRDKAQKLQQIIIEHVNQQCSYISADLQMLRDDNAMAESERDPDYRDRVKVEAKRVTDEVRRICGVVQDVV